MDVGRVARRSAALALAMGLTAAAPSWANHQTVTGLTNEDPSRIVQFAVGTPGTLLGGATPIPIIGLDPTNNNDDLLGIDYRPRTNTLYAQGSGGTIYLLTPGAGAADPFTATVVGTGAVDPADADSGFDFNPVVDAIRLVNVNDQNFRFNPTSASNIATDGTLAFAAGDSNAGEDPAVGASAYANNLDGATTTTLFDIEAANNALVTQNPPNAGTLNTLGTLPGGDVTTVAGFDIETQTGNAYAALQTTGTNSSSFYRLDLTNGAALNTFGPIAGGVPIESVSLRPIPQLQFANAVTSVREGGSATVTVTRQGPLNQGSTVNYASELASDDAAAAGDFTATNGTLTFAPGDASESFALATTADSADEGDESLTVRLSSPSTSVNLPVPATAKVNVVDDDDAPVTPTPTPPPTPTPTPPAVAPLGLISVATQRIDGSLRARFSCTEKCVADLTLSFGNRRLARRVLANGRAGINSVSFALSKGEVRLLKRASRGSRSAKLTIRGTFSDGDGSSRSTVTFRLG